MISVGLFITLFNRSNKEVHILTKRNERQFLLSSMSLRSHKAQIPLLRFVIEFLALSSLYCMTTVVHIVLSGVGIPDYRTTNTESLTAELWYMMIVMLLLLLLIIIIIIIIRFFDVSSCYLQGAAKKVIPCRILQIFKQPLRIFWSNFAITFSVQTDIKLPNIV